MTLRAAIAVLAAGCVLPLAPCGRAAAATIVWNSAAPVLVKAGGGYGRIRRLDARTLLACYTFRGSAHVSHSHDEGKTWEGPVKVADHPAGVLTNTELCVLKNGDVLCFFNFRPREQGKLPYAIGMSRSRDGGKTWATPQNLYAAGNKFKDGCWEPACLLLPDGELQVYFANEGPYRHSDEQEISMLRSRDDGHTWSKAETIAFRKNSRDGMPVPVLARTGNTIVVAIEDNGMQGTFKPVIVASRLERNGWRDGAVTGDSPRRWGRSPSRWPPPLMPEAPTCANFPAGRSSSRSNWRNPASCNNRGWQWPSATSKHATSANPLSHFRIPPAEHSSGTRFSSRTPAPSPPSRKPRSTAPAASGPSMAPSDEGITSNTPEVRCPEATQQKTARFPVRSIH